MPGPHTSVVAYSHIRHLDICDWCSERFVYTTWSVTMHRPERLNGVRCLIVRFDNPNHKLMFDLIWSEKMRVFENVDSYVNFANGKRDRLNQYVKDLANKI